MALWPAVLISLATSLLRTLGLVSSPLLVSTQRTLIGPRPIRLRASEIGLISQTPFDLK